MNETKDPHFVIHTAVTIMAKRSQEVFYRPNPRIIGGVEPYVPVIGEDVEIGQFACEFSERIISEKKFRAAFRQMEEACVERARRSGLVVS